MQRKHETELKPLIVNNKFRAEPIVGFLFPCESVIPASPNLLTVQINLDVINQNDADFVKKNVWGITKKYLNRKRNKQKLPSGEIGELTKLYSIIKEDTFNKYLRWYDYHLQHRIGFRLIAFIENQIRGDSDKAKSLIEKIIKKPKKPQVGNYNPRTKKVEVLGEDKIEKAVKLIYKAIYREDYSKKKIEPFIELDNRNCPIHRNIDSCPLNCQHLQDWYNKANKILPPKY